MRTILLTAAAFIVLGSTPSQAQQNPNSMYNQIIRQAVPNQNKQQRSRVQQYDYGVNTRGGDIGSDADASGVTTLDVDEMFRKQDQQRRRTPPPQPRSRGQIIAPDSGHKGHFPTCRDGSQPILGFCKDGS